MSTSSPQPANETNSTGKKSSSESTSDQRKDLLYRHDPLSAEERNQLNEEEVHPDPEMIQHFKDNPLSRVELDPPKTLEQMELEQYIRALCHPFPPSSTVIQDKLEKFLRLWDRGVYKNEQLTNDQIWYLRVAKRITLRDALTRALCPWGKEHRNFTRWIDQLVSQNPEPEICQGCGEEHILGSSQSTAGTTSENTLTSKELSSSSTSSDSSDPDSGQKPSYVYLAEIPGFY